MKDLRLCTVANQVYFIDKQGQTLYEAIKVCPPKENLIMTMCPVCFAPVHRKQGHRRCNVCHTAMYIKCHKVLVEDMLVYRCMCKENILTEVPELPTPSESDQQTIKDIASEKYYRVVTTFRPSRLKGRFVYRKGDFDSLTQTCKGIVLYQPYPGIVVINDRLTLTTRQFVSYVLQAETPSYRTMNAAFKKKPFELLIHVIKMNGII
jgi:hypothetical protein